jgi:class 3 adenylate cyclase/tetratricopeptide (TPR) repeat protein
MFCDLVGSTPLSGQLDPEDLREVVRAYQQSCAEVVQRFDGHIAQLLGDALLVYFGWPQAHEDDAQRVVHTGLGMLDAIRVLNTQLERDQGLRIAIRVGIHTGLVVVGAMGGGSYVEQLALGETPNIAARLQGLADPNTVLISDTTYRLIEGYFTVKDLGLHSLKGVSQPMPVYRILEANRAQSRMDVGAIRGLTPLVGREQEVGLLVGRWQQVREGHGQVVLLSGEPGIGKSRLVQVLKDHLEADASLLLECRSSPYYQHTALYPVTDLLQRVLQWQRNDSPGQRLRQLEQLLRQYRLPWEETVTLLGPLLSLPLPADRYPPLPISPQRQRQKTLEALVAMLVEQAERQPVLFILEDLHWSDPSTLEWLELLIERIPTAPLLALLTCRPEFQPPWGLRTYLTPLAVHRLTRSQIETMVLRVTGGRSVPAEIMQHLVEKTDGVPLYIEEMTKAILEAGVLQATNGHYELTGSISDLAIPMTLRDSLMARLDRLGTAKGTAQLGATIGRQFTYPLLCAVSPADEATLQRDLRRLVEAELVYQRGVTSQATYTFKHALIRDTAYQSLLRRTRQQYHERIAQALEAHFPEMVATQPELLAQHYTEAGLHQQAVDCWYKAGQQAEERLAYVEAVAHLTKGLETLTLLPDASERTAQELTFHLALHVPLAAVEGHGSLPHERALLRAQELMQTAGDAQQRIQLLGALVTVYWQRHDLQPALTLAEQLLALALEVRDVRGCRWGHHNLGFILFQLGELATAQSHPEQSLTFYIPQQVHIGVDMSEPRVFPLGVIALVLWTRGYPDQALQHLHKALAIAQEVAHPFSLGVALGFATRLYLYRCEWHLTQEYLAALQTLRSEHGLQRFAAEAAWIRGAALVGQGQLEAGIAQLRQWLDATQGREPPAPLPLALLAEAYGEVGQVQEGLTKVDEALAAVHPMGKRVSLPRLYCVKSKLLLTLSVEHRAEAETCLHQALAIARQQQSKMWELRAATGLARLWQSQGKRQDAYDMLAPVYDWFTEGFDTVDLQEAKALLQELG